MRYIGGLEVGRRTATSTSFTDARKRSVASHTKPEDQERGSNVSRRGIEPSASRCWRSRMLVILGLVGAVEAGAQDLRGTVRESAGGQPISGAVIVLLDSGGAMLGRNITNERGEYRVTDPATVRHIRVLRIGFRPRELSVPSSNDDVTRLDVVMTPIPALLEPLRIRSNARCSRRSDRGAALALLEQAQAGLLTTVVAREANPARLVLLKFDRTMVGATDRIERQTVHIDSVRRSARSYQAVRPAADFVERGFALDDGDGITFTGPDADVLLDDQFTSGYCFHLHDPETERPHQVGLAFVPAGRRSGRVDIDGTLWVDTATHALREIEFRYLGLNGAENLHLGGRVSFHEMENGVVLIDRWVLRLPSPGADTTYSLDRTPIIRAKLYARETGGEVASASWSDGHTWTASLGRVRIHAVGADGTPVANAIVRLDSTGYAASSDARGDLEISNLAPGPYVVAVSTPPLATFGMVFHTALRFAATRDSVVDVRLLVAPVDEFVRPDCTEESGGEDPNQWLLIRIVDADGMPVENAHWYLSRELGPSWQQVTESGRTDAAGQAHYCMRLARGDAVSIRAWRDGEPATPSLRRYIGRPRTEITVKLPRGR